MTIHEMIAGAAAGEIPRCDPELFTDGTCVAILAGGSAHLIQRFVKEVAELSGQKVDWHYAGGRARVLASGDLPLVVSAIERLTLYVQLQ
jgi:hypothetical protein